MGTERHSAKGERRREDDGALPFGGGVLHRRLGTLSDGLNYVVGVICIFCILMMLGISFVGALYMSFTGDALSWTYSLARLFIPWLALLSITIAFKKGEHIAMTSLLEMMPARVQTMLRAVNLGVAGLFAGLLVWYGWSYAASARQLYMVSDQIQIDARWVAAAVPVTGLILVVHMLCGRLMLGGISTLGMPDLEAEAEIRQP